MGEKRDFFPQKHYIWIARYWLSHHFSVLGTITGFLFLFWNGKAEVKCYLYLKGSRYSLIIHEVLFVCCCFFPAGLGVQDETLREELANSSHNNDFNLTLV